MVGIAIFSTDPVLRRNLEQLPRDDPAVVIARMAISSAIVPLHVATTGPMASLARRRRASSQETCKTG